MKGCRGCKLRFAGVTAIASSAEVRIVCSNPASHPLHIRPLLSTSVVSLAGLGLLIESEHAAARLDLSPRLLTVLHQHTGLTVDPARAPPASTRPTLAVSTLQARVSLLNPVPPPPPWERRRRSPPRTRSPRRSAHEHPGASSPPPPPPASQALPHAPPRADRLLSAPSQSTSSLCACSIASSAPGPDSNLLLYTLPRGCHHAERLPVWCLQGDLQLRCALQLFDLW